MLQTQTDSASGSTELPSHLPRPARVVVRHPLGNSQKILAKEISGSLNLSNVTARLLVSRGAKSVEDAQRFLLPTLREHIPDPSRVKNIIPAARMILDAIAKRKQITIYTDFDVDGLSAGAQLEIFLESIGGVINHYVPNRFAEGYGVAASAIELLARAGTELLITVDCGITNVNEIALAKRRGISTIIVDHHQPRDLPDADVIVNPAQGGCEFEEHCLCAAGLVWMLLIVLRSELKTRLSEEKLVAVPDPKDFLDLAALGTICDMVPLTGVNRVIASRGLDALRQTERPGLVALKRAAGFSDQKKLNAGHVSFGIGPRINASGRLADAKEVLELLTTRSAARAKKLADKLNRLNIERREIEDDVRLSCIEMVNSSQRWQDAAALALYADDFHPGVIGIVAQRLVEHYYKPAAVMASGEITDGKNSIPVIKGSIRSVEGFHVADALQSLDHLLIKHGGHAQAGGFTLDATKLSEFQDAFVELADSLIPEERRVRERTADIEVTLAEIDYQVVDELGKLAPFGVGNPSPLFVSFGVTIESVQNLSQGHLRVRFSDGNNSYLNGVAWRFKGHPLLTRGKIVNIAYQPELNTYQGLSSVQLNIREVWS